MSETPSDATPPPYAQSQPPPAPPYGQNPYGQQPYGSPTGAPIGKVRSTGLCMVLFIVTFGIYSWVWFFSTHEEMKRHSGQGIGGAIALILAIFVGIVSPYLSSAEVGGLYERAGREKPVSGLTGLWYFPGIFILVGPIVWFVKTNGALNDYWVSQGATA